MDEGDFALDGATDQDLLGVANCARNLEDEMATGCDHQLPRIVAPTMASASEGTGPRADSRTTPCLRTKARASRGVIDDSFGAV